jgi:hypothetical protein
MSEVGAMAREMIIQKMKFKATAHFTKEVSQNIVWSV